MNMTGRVEQPRRYRGVATVGAQYTIRPEYSAIPPGWYSTGKTGTMQERQSYLREIYTDSGPTVFVASRRREHYQAEIGTAASW